MGDKPVKRMWIAATVILVLLVAGCAGVGSKGGGGSPVIPPENAGVVVSVTPATAAVRAGATQTFVAAVTGNANTSVTWSVNAVAGGNTTTGTIDATGLYTAPVNLPTPNTITVTATSAADTTKTGNSALTLENPLPVLTSVSPNTIAPGSFSLTLNGSGFIKYIGGNVRRADPDGDVRVARRNCKQWGPRQRRKPGACPWWCRILILARLRRLR